MEALTLKTGGVYRTTRRNFGNSQLDFRTGTGFTYTLDEVDAPGPQSQIQGRYLLTSRIDVETANRLFADNRERFAVTMRLPLADYRVQEDVFAGYVQGSYRVGAMTLLAGLRYERTEVDSTGSRVAAGALTPVERSGSYDNWLPGLHLRYDLSGKLVFRAAYTNTMGRPDFGSISAMEALTFDGSQPLLN